MPIGKKTKTYNLINTKAFFQTKDLARSANRSPSDLLSKNILNWSSQTPDRDCKLARNYKLFRSSVALL